MNTNNDFPALSSPKCSTTSKNVYPPNNKKYKNKKGRRKYKAITTTVLPSSTVTPSLPTVPSSIEIPSDSLSLPNQLYLDSLFKNTSDIDLVQSRYLDQLDNDMDNFNVQSGFAFIANQVKHKLQQVLPIEDSRFQERYIIKLVEDILYFMTLSIERVEGKSTIECISRAAILFLKLRFNESAFILVRDKALPFIHSIFEGYNPQSSDYIASARDLLNSYKSINESPIVIKLYKCAMYIMSLSIFDKIGLSMDNLGYTKLEQAALKKKFYKRTDFIYVLMDTALFIIERGYQVYVTGDVSSIFHSGGQYKLIYEKCRLLDRRQQLLMNPEEHGFSECEFRADLDEVIEKLTNIQKHSYRLPSADVGMVKDALNRMLIMRDDLNTKSSARRNRRAPFGVLIYGDSGIGKTTITTMLSIIYAKHKNLPIGPEFCYTRNPAAKFWDGFVTSCHTVILDDVANEAPELGDPKSVNEIIQIMNNQAFCPDQASLESKGTTPFKASLVIATTNVKNLNAYHYFSAPTVVQRRFPFIITPRVRPEYVDSRGMLNSSMVADLSAFPDLWLFNVDLVKPVPLANGKRLATIVPLLKDIDLKELLTWYVQAIDTFDLDQNKVTKCVEAMRKIELCTCCSLPDGMCNMRVQSAEIYVGFFAILMIVFYYIMHTQIVMDIIYWYKIYFKYRGNVKQLCCTNIKYYARRGTAASWERMGDLMNTKLKHPALLTAMAGMLTTTFAMYRIYNNISPQSGESDVVGSRPIDELNGRENVWYNNSVDLTPANFTRESASSKSMQFTQFCKKISNNVAYIEIVKVDGLKAINARMICLGGHVWITNNHNIPTIHGSTTMRVVLDGKVGIHSNISITLTNDDIHRIPSRDLAFIMLREIPPKKKIIKYFHLGEPGGTFNGCYAGRNADGSLYTNTVKNVKRHAVRDYKFPDNGINSSHPTWCGYVDTPTLPGDCGTPLIVECGYGFAIIGIHFLAHNVNTSQIFANCIDGDFLSSVYDKLTPYSAECGDFTLVSADGAKRELTDLHKKSVFRYLNGGNAHVYGTFTGFRGGSKSSVSHTPMSHFLSNHGYKIKFFKPVMTTWVPWHIAAKDLIKPIATLRTDIMNLCVASFIGDIMDNIDPDNISGMLMPLDNFTAINGAQVAYIDKMNRNTSAGNPWKKSKRFFMEAIPEEHGMLDPVKVSDEILERVDSIIETYLGNMQVHPNFCAHLKDEPVSAAKAKIGKTRVFTGAPMDWTIVVRKYLLSFARLQQNERFAFEAAPGTVAQSLEWDEIYHYVTKFGCDRIVAGDYKAFDKRMSSKEILAAFDIIIHFCQMSGNYSADDITVIRGIAEDTAFSLVDFNGDLVQFFGSNPSGHPLTVIINGLVNSLRMRYVFFELRPPGCDSTFKQTVNLMTYGDDNIMSVAKGHDWFNHTSIADAFDLLDITYTMADKEATSVPYINISESSFLKRSWRYDEELKCMVAPLHHDSVQRMLMVWNKSKSVCEEAQGIAVITTALREYAYYGRLVYEEKKLLFEELVKELGWELFIEKSTFPSFDELLQFFKKSSKKCENYESLFHDFDVQSGEHQT